MSENEEITEHSGIIKYEDWLFRWLSAKKLFVKESTYIRYRNMIGNHICPELGKYPVDKITLSLIEGFIHKKLKNGRMDGSGGISSKTLNDILTVIRETLSYAQSRGNYTVCRLSEVTVKKKNREMRVLSRSEEYRLISVLRHDMDRYKLGVYLCLYTGIRVGELCALKWSDISFSDMTLSVRGTMQRIQKEDACASSKTHIIITEPKSSTASRMIPLPQFLLDTLRPFCAGSDAFVLSGETDKFIEPRTMQNRFKVYLSEGGISDANYHALRHTFATRCVELGFDVKTLSEILGHSSVKITLDKYVHSSMELKKINMDKLCSLA